MKSMKHPSKDIPKAAHSYQMNLIDIYKKT